jgi:hypothetical protein
MTNSNTSPKRLEVYTLPSEATAVPAFAQRQNHPLGDDVTLVLDATAVANIPVRELLP